MAHPQDLIGEEQHFFEARRKVFPIARNQIFEMPRPVDIGRMAT